MLEVRNLTKVYTPKRGVPVRALDGVNVKFEETGMVFVLGKSGSGKSTFLNLIGGLDTITEGDVLIKGKSSLDFSQSDFDSYRNTFIGFIFQEYNILNEFTVGKNIALALELQGKKADRQAVDEILEQVDLQGYANRRPNELSGGQKQRIAIARALIKDPEIIMADEPTGALDSNTGKQVFETLQKLSRTKLVIIVSHDRDYAEFYGDRVIEFADGRIISDIKKYKAQSQVLSSGVSVVDGKILHIKKGHKFTDAEKTAVLGFLESASGDMIVSKDEKSNGDFRRLARIDTDGNKESFENVTPEKQNIKQYDPKKFKLIRSRLPLRHSLKIAGSSLKVKPIRLFITILLSAIAFGMFGLADTVGAYNKYEAAYTSMQMANVNYASFVKSSGFIDDYDNEYRGEDSRMTETDFKKLSDQFSGRYTFDALRSPYPHSYYGVTQFGYSANLVNYQKDSSKVGMFYTHANPMRGVGDGPSFGGIVEIPDGATGASFRGYSVTGRFPAAQNEVMISRHVFDAIKDLGFLDVDSYVANGTKNTIDNYKLIVTSEQSLLDLDKPFYIGGNSGDSLDDGIPARIVGIVDTQFPDIYDSYKTASDSGSQSGGMDMYAEMMKGSEIASLFQFGYHGALFMREGSVDFIKSLTATESKYFRIEGNTNLSLSTNPQMGGVGFSFAASQSQIGQDGLTAFLIAGKTALGENEVAVGLNQAGRLIGLSEWWGDQFGNDPAKTQEVAAVRDVIGSFTGYSAPAFTADAVSVVAGRHGTTPQQAEDMMIANTGGVGTGSVEQYLLTQADWLEGTPVFDLKESFEKAVLWGRNHEARTKFCGLSYENAKQQAAAKFFIETEMPAGGIPVTGYLSSSSGRGSQLSVKIVGIALDAEENHGFNQNGIILPSALYDRLTSGAGGDIVAAITRLPEGKAEQMEMIRFSYSIEKTGNSISDWSGDDVDEYYQFGLRNSVTETLNQINGMVTMFTQVFLYVGIGFAVFAGFLLMNFIMVSITHKKREIGILRAIGARSGDVFMIFFFESLMIALISFAVAMVGCFLGAYFINQALLQNLGFIISLINFGIRQIALVLAVSIGVAFVATFLPVFNTSRKKPIDAIRKA